MQLLTYLMTQSDKRSIDEVFLSGQYSPIPKPLKPISR